MKEGTKELRNERERRRKIVLLFMKTRMPGEGDGRKKC